jgi:protein-S-isoprenylcysteine O-methyltransferase Ste14
MKFMSLWQWELIPWEAFFIYFAISMFRVKQTKAPEPLASRLPHIALMVAAAVLLFTTRFRMGFLGSRFIAESIWPQYAGIMLTSLGTAVALWARYSLGRYWSSEVVVKENHQLIRSGPYAYVRHPIYTGMLLAGAGTTLFIGEWRGIFAVLLAATAQVRKARKEEVLMKAEFGDQYMEYRKHTGFLTPRTR